MALGTPKGFRLHLGLLGRRNVGKSSLLNALAGQRSSIVSVHAGTTTDPVFKPMELQPIGPVLFIDTAGLDDEGDLGQLRVERTRKLLDRLDLAILVAEAGGWEGLEQELLVELESRSTPVIVVMNKADVRPVPPTLRAALADRGTRIVLTVATTGQGLDELRAALAELAPVDTQVPQTIISELIGPGELALLVIPIDKEAPKGRLILPQAQALRELLDHGRLALVTRDEELRRALASLGRPPALVVTDSQALLRVAAETPEEIPLTTFSALFSRFKGDLVEQARGAVMLEHLKPGGRVLLAEACTHHPIADDIAREKLPRMLTSLVGGPLAIDFCRGHDFPEDLSKLDMVVHCGACMMNRKEVLARIALCRDAALPITNYGLAIAGCLGLVERVLRPFQLIEPALGELLGPPATSWPEALAR